MSKITALYVRVSTDEQAKEGSSIDSQINTLKQFCVYKNLQNSVLYIDDGYSAKDMRRPRMKQLIKDIKADKVAAVLTIRIDRLSRNLLDMLQFVDMCEEHKTSFVCTSIDFDTSTPIGRMTLQILSSFAEFERAMTSARVKETMLDVAETQGRYLTTPPLGYRFDDDKRLVIVPEEAALVKRIASMYISGYGYRGIAKQFNNEGIVPRSGKSWYDSTVRGILTNETYIGTVIWNRRYSDKNGKVRWRDKSEWVINENCHEPILSQEEWDEIQKRIKRKVPKGGQRVVKYKLSGILRCGECGAPMISRNYGNKGPHAKRKIFVCSSYQKQGSCRFHYVFQDEVEKEVLDAIEEIASGNIDIPVERLEQSIVDRDADYEQQLAAINRKFQRQIQAYENGLIDDEDLRLAKERVENEKSDLLAKQTEQVDTSEIKKSLEGITNEIVWFWKDGELPVLNSLLRSAFDYIVVVGGKVTDVVLSQDLFKG